MDTLDFNAPIEPVPFPIKTIKPRFEPLKVIDVFKKYFSIADIPIYLLRVEIKVSDRENSETDDPVYIEIGDSTEKYYLNKGGDDFGRNATYYYSIRPKGISKVSDITRIKIAKTGHDDLRIRWFKLHINGKGSSQYPLFAKHFDNGSKYGGKIIDEGNVILIEKDVIRDYYSNKSTKGRIGKLPKFKVDFVYGRVWLWGSLSISESLFEELVATKVGDTNQKNKLYWGGKHGDKWVRCYHKSESNRSTIHTDVDLKCSANNLPDPEIDLDFDIEFSTSISDGKIKIEGNIKNTRIGGDILLDTYKSLSSEVEDKISDAIIDMNDRAFNFSLPELTLQQISTYLGGDIIFSFISTRPTIYVSDGGALELKWDDTPKQFPSKEFDVELYKKMHIDLVKGNPPEWVFKGKSNLGVFNYWQEIGLPLSGHRGSFEFAVNFYLETHADLRSKFKIERTIFEAIGDAVQAAAQGAPAPVYDYLGAYNHWKERGLMQEGLRGSREFDVQFYLDRYHKNQGRSYMFAYDDWVRTGLLVKGRRGSREFDLQFYFAYYRSVYNFNEDMGWRGVMQHWITIGLPQDGLRGSPEFDVKFYLDCYSNDDELKDKDYRAATLHWIKTGLPQEGRRGSVEFDAKYFLARRPSLGIDYQAAFDDWVNKDLEIDGSQGSREFDVYFYLNTNPWVHAAAMNYAREHDGSDGLEDAVSKYRFGLYDWIKDGLLKGRRGSRDFDARFYRDCCDDLGDKDYHSATLHWIKTGLLEGRRGSLELDVKFYIAQYPELNFGTDYQAALDHWIGYGLSHGKRGSREFDVRFYINMYEDLDRGFDKRRKALDHWITQGLSNGFRSSREFDVRYYKNYYRDLRDKDYRAAALHWIKTGLSEGRRGSLEFDVKFYIAQYPELNFGTDYQKALDHWIKIGLSEGRRGSREFDVKFYKNQYDDVKRKVYLAAFDHWITKGKYEGRKGAE